MQLYRTVNSVQSDAKRLITVNVHEECYFFVCLHRLIYNICLMHVLSRARTGGQWMRQLCVVQCCAKRLSSKLKSVSNAENKLLQ